MPKEAPLTRIAVAIGLLLLLSSAPFGQEATYQPLGQYYANSAGPTSTYLRLPGNDGEYRDWLSWGYDIWGHGTETVPEEAGWISSESLYDAPYNIPRDATAVRLHFKVKATGVTWYNGQVFGSLQVKARPAGSEANPNEMVHATTQKPAGQPDVTPYDLNHVQVDILLGEDGRVEVYRAASIIGDHMQLDLIVYLAGYWAP